MKFDLPLLGNSNSDTKCDSSHECINFGVPHYVKDGFSAAGVQRIKCGYCGKRMSSQTRPLLPVLLKTHRELSKPELYALGFIKSYGQFSNKNCRLTLTTYPNEIEQLNQIKSYLDIDSKIIKVQQGRYISFSWQHKDAAPCWSYLGMTIKDYLPYMHCLEFKRGAKLARI